MPPVTDTVHGKLSGIMANPAADPACIFRKVLLPIRRGFALLFIHKIMDIDLNRLPFGMVFLPTIFILANEFFLLGIHRNYGLPMLLKGFGFLSDKAKLGISVRMVRTFFDFAGALQTVIHLVQQLCHQTMGLWRFRG